MRSLFARLPVATKITGAFIAVASGWIALSNEALVRFVANPEQHTIRVSLFVAVLALVIHLVIRRLVARFEATETALRASDERWNHAFKGTGDGVWDWDCISGQTFLSFRWKEILGYEEAELVGRHSEWEERVHPEDRPRVLKQLNRHYLGETPGYDCEYRLRAKDGSYKWVLSRGRVVHRGANGRPTRVIGALTDITARKDAEARIKDALIFNQVILQSAPVAIMTYRTDGQTVSANEAAAQYVGTDVETLLRQNFRQLESWRRYGLVERADRALKENSVVFHSTKLVTTFGRTRWWEITFAPFQFEGEQRLMVIAHDTTKQHAAQERLELLHAALEAAPTGWVVTNADGVIEWVNPGFTKLTGYALEEAMGRNLSLLKSGRQTAGFYAHLWATIKDGQIWQGELCNRRKNGSFFYERMTIAPVRDADGGIAHFVAMKEDISGRHELEQQLSRSHRLESIGLLASGIAHDLNNMLAPVMLAVGLIRTRHKDAETGELLDMMQAAAQRGASVVQQVLTFARGVEGARVQLDLRPLLRELAQLARETFPREIKVVVEVPASPSLVEGDVTQLHQVLLNLAVNARDAMPDGGVLRLQIETVALDESAARLAPAGKAGHYVKLVVSDTGAGIPPEVLDHIFEPFFTTKPRGQGTGLGLSTAYGIVRSHGGFLDVQSKMGEGTSIAVLLPASAAVAAAATRAQVSAKIAGEGRRVLLVDDEESIRLALGAVLEKNGFAVVKAEDGFVALRRLQEQPEGFSIAVVDLMMPGMSGYKLVRELRQLAPALPIIVASGMTGDGKAGEDRAALTAQGVRRILSKPFTEADLLEALNSELGVPA